MQKTSIGDVRSRVIGRLSKGYKQRVGVAQALLNNPEVLVLDEPTIGLDPKQIFEVRSLIKNLAGDHTVILSTHILPEVSMTCNRVVIINNGKVVAMDTPEGLANQVKGAERVAMLVDGPVDAVREKLSAVEGVLSVKADGRRRFPVQAHRGMQAEHRPAQNPGRRRGEPGVGPARIARRLRQPRGRVHQPGHE